jgi:hypothetical protein
MTIYDTLKRTLTVSNSGTSGFPTVVLTSAYDANSNRTKLTSTVGGTADFENDYTFDNLQRLTRIDQVGQTGGNTVADKRLDLEKGTGPYIDGWRRPFEQMHFGQLLEGPASPIVKG